MLFSPGIKVGHERRYVLGLDEVLVLDRGDGDESARQDPHRPYRVAVKGEIKSKRHLSSFPGLSKQRKENYLLWAVLAIFTFRLIYRYSLEAVGNTRTPGSASFKGFQRDANVTLSKLRWELLQRRMRDLYLGSDRSKTVSLFMWVRAKQNRCNLCQVTIFLAYVCVYL